MATPIRERCGGCGAAVEIEALACAYCGAPSPHAARARAARDEAELAREEAQIRDAQTTLARSSNYAVVWSLVGVVTCCAPFAGAIGLAKGLEAKRTARANGWIAPARATAAVILSALSLLACVGFWIFVVIDMRAQEARKDELRAYVEAHAAEAPLTQSTACSIAELYLREEGFGEHSRTSAGRAFECPGRLTVDGDRGRIADASFKPSNHARVHVDVCLRHGGRWYATQAVDPGAPCDDATDTATTANE